MSPRIRVVMVSKLFPISHYTIYLGRGFESLRSKIETIFYRSRSEHIVVPLEQVKNVWSQSPIYPLQVFRQSIEDRPDIVHIQHEFDMFGGPLTTVVFPFLLLLLRVRRIKTVVTVHQVVPTGEIDKLFAKTFSFPQTFYLLLKIALISIYSFIARFASAVIVHSEYNKRVMVSDYGAKLANVNVVPIGVPKREFDGYENAKWTTLLSGKKVILFFGYLVERKGVEFLIEAFSRIARRHDDWVLVIAGGLLSYSSPYVKKLIKLISDLQMTDRVIFLTTTPFPVHEIHELYELSEFVVLPYTYSFSASLALSFAMQHSKPVVATNMGVFKEEIGHNVDGLLCLPRSIDSLEEAMEKLIQDIDLRKTFSWNIRLKAESRSWNRVAQQTYNVYSSVLIQQSLINKTDC